MKIKQRISLIIMTAMLATTLAVGQAQAALISQSSELQMGRDAARQIESRYPVSRDARLNSMVTNIGRQMASVSSRPNIPWQFKVLEVRDVNALSVPGYVYVNRGLIDFTVNDRAALASVIAHEVAHTSARHAVRAAEKQFKYSLALQLLFKRGSARQLGTFAANLALLGYSRSEENEADRLGVRYMAATGYDPNGMLRFFRALQQREGRDSGGLSVYFRTHPPTSDRIGRIRQEISSMGIRPTASVPARLEELVLLV